MKNCLKSLAITFATVCVLLIMAVPAFAATGTGWYQPGTAVTYTNPIKVKIILNSRKDASNDYIQEVDEVTLGTNNMSATSFTVADALLAYDNQTNDYDVVGTNHNIGVLYDIKKISTNVTFGPALYTPYQIFGNTYYYPIDGWMFRVNGKIPTSSSSNTNAQGLDTAHTYIEDGDVISFYTDCPWKVNSTKYSTYFISAHSTYSNGVLTVQLKKDMDYFIAPLDTATWSIENYTSYNPSGYNTATVIREDGHVEGTIQLQYGHGTMNCSLNSNYKYYVSVNDCVSWHTITGYNSSGSSTSVDHLERTIAYDKVIF